MVAVPGAAVAANSRNASGAYGSFRSLVFDMNRWHGTRTLAYLVLLRPIQSTAFIRNYVAPQD